MRFKIHPLGLFLLASILSILFLGCGGRKAQKISLTVLQTPPASVWVITSDETTHIFQLPKVDSILSLPATELLSYWSNGILKKSEGKVEWLELDEATGTYKSVPNDLTSWIMPIAVDPVERIIYALGHTVPPMRQLEMHYLDGRPSTQAGQLTADEIETLSPLPTNGWPVFYVDRKASPEAVNIDNSPTRKLRVYGGTNIGGEFPNVLGVFFLPDNVVLNREDEGWFLCEIHGATVYQRTMSVDQIPGKLRPLTRIGDIVLIASDEVEGGDPAEATETEKDKPADEKVKSCTLYSYGAYTRDVVEVWKATLSNGRPAIILSIAAAGLNDYYMVLGSLPDQKKLTVVHYLNGQTTDVATVTLRKPVESTSIFLLNPPETEGFETAEPSAGPTEEAVTPSGSETEEAVTGSTGETDEPVAPTE